MAGESSAAIAKSHAHRRATTPVIVRPRRARVGRSGRMLRPVPSPRKPFSASNASRASRPAVNAAAASPSLKGARHRRNDALPFGGRDAPVVAAVAQDDGDALVPAREEQHRGSVRRREELALEEERLGALARLGLGTLALEEEALEGPRERREQRTSESCRQNCDRGDERRVRAGPVGTQEIGGDDAERRERGARGERAPAQSVIAVGAIDDGRDRLDPGTRLERAYSRFGRGELGAGHRLTPVNARGSSRGTAARARSAACRRNRPSSRPRRSRPCP